MRVVIAPDGFGGVLRASEVADAVAEGWRRARPGDEVAAVPMSDGGEGLLEVLGADPAWRETAVEVAGPRGHPLDATVLHRDDGTAVIESARACGLSRVPAGERSPMPATTYGVGQLIAAAHRVGASRLLVGLGGSATVDGGSGALNGLGFRLRVDDGSGLKVGAADLHRVRHVEPTWAPDLSGVTVELLADVDIALLEAPALFGPQKGATPDQIAGLETALEIWADVAERDLDAPGLRHEAGTGAAGGLGFGLAAGLGASLVPGADRVADLVGLPAALAGGDLVVTGEGRLDAGTGHGKVVDHVARRGRELGRPVLAVVGAHDAGADIPLDDVEAASPDGPREDPRADAVAAAERLAARFTAR